MARSSKIWALLQVELGREGSGGGRGLLGFAEQALGTGEVADHARRFGGMVLHPAADIWQIAEAPQLGQAILGTVEPVSGVHREPAGVRAHLAAGVALRATVAQVDIECPNRVVVAGRVIAGLAVDVGQADPAVTPFAVLHEARQAIADREVVGGDGLGVRTPLRLRRRAGGIAGRKRQAAGEQGQCEAGEAITDHAEAPGRRSHSRIDGRGRSIHPRRLWGLQWHALVRPWTRR